MTVIKQNIIPLIESKFAEFTRSERKVATFFLNHTDTNEKTDLSGKVVASVLKISESSLTRFAQKCNFRGYREFVYAFNLPSGHEKANFAEPVLTTYQELLNKTYALIEVNNIHAITKLLLQKKPVYIYGKGSSGMVAREMKLRFMRIGLVCEAITDDDMIRMNEVLVDDNCLVIGISISGKTQIVIESLTAAADRGAATVLLTANANTNFAKSFDILQPIAVKNNLEYGRIISPQFPILVILDVIYADYMRHEKSSREAIWQTTYDALQKNKQ